MKYSHDNCVEVLWAEIVTAKVNTVHLLTCSCIKIALLKVSHNFLIKDFIFLQGRPLVKQTYWTELQKYNDELDSLIFWKLI